MPSNSKRSRSRFPLVCGCKDSMSVSVPVPVPVPVSDTSDKSAATSKDLPSFADTQTATTEMTFSSSFEMDYEDAASSSTPSFSGLLRQLSELEKNVMEWAPPIEEDGQQEEQQHAAEDKRRLHRRCRSEGGGRVEESVAVVKESEDPLADFRRSMLQMIVEKEIVGGEELRELLQRFLQLNSPLHHDVILRAFADIWNEVFSGYEDTPDLLRRSRSNYYPRRRQHY